jgi:2-dehydro-3-deoxygluconokinase
MSGDDQRPTTNDQRVVAAEQPSAVVARGNQAPIPEASVVGRWSLVGSEATYDVVTLGETMIRLSPTGYTRLEEAGTLDCRTGGSESNVAAGLARLGLRSAWLSKLPENPLGRLITRRLHSLGVDISHVLWTPEGRVGVYFIEPGSTPRPTRVLYDRADSVASRMTPEEMPWNVVRSARHLHLSGITPALSPTCRAVALRAVQEARDAGATVSLDLNYRSKLWSPAEAAATLAELLPRVDLLITTGVDAEIVFGEAGDGPDVGQRLRERFAVPAVVVTMGGGGACACTSEGVCEAQSFPIAAVDRVGAGDAFDAGLLYGYLQGDLSLGLTYGMGMAAIKHSVPGDECVTSLAEVEELIAVGRRDIHR